MRLRRMSKETKDIALSRIRTLFQLAQEAIHERPDLAHRYIEIANKIAMRTRLHFPKEYQLLVCGHCKRFILPGVNSRVRIQPKREPHMVITCLDCGAHMRITLKRKKKDEKA